MIQSKPKSQNSKSSRSNHPTSQSSATAVTPNRYGIAAGAQKFTNDSFYPSLTNERDRLALEKADAHKEKLLEYQRNAQARTQIHGIYHIPHVYNYLLYSIYLDTASDFDYKYESQNKWLSAEERELALKKAVEMEKEMADLRKRRAVTLDLVNKTVISVKNEPTGRYLSLKNTVENSSTTVAPESHIPDTTTGVFRNPHITVLPQFVPVKLNTLSDPTFKSRPLTHQMKKDLREVESRLEHEKSLQQEQQKSELEKLRVELGGDSKSRRAYRRNEKYKENLTEEEETDAIDETRINRSEKEGGLPRRIVQDDFEEMRNFELGYIPSRAQPSDETCA